MSTSLAIAWIGLMAAPPIGVSAFLAASRLHPARIKRAVIASALFIAGIAGIARLDISFTSNAANVACLVAAYLAYAFLAASVSLIRPLVLRIPALVIAALPVVAGYVMATVGYLGMAFVIGAHANAASQTLRVHENLECRVTTWGNVTADAGYTVTLYRQWTLIPWVEREVFRVNVNETRPGSGPVTASCQGALAAMR